jgi:hypothetical protein
MPCYESRTALDEQIEKRDWAEHALCRIFKTLSVDQIKQERIGYTPAIEWYVNHLLQDYRDCQSRVYSSAQKKDKESNDKRKNEAMDEIERIGFKIADSTTKIIIKK